jgi:vacuolar-type H+-ATPase subunit H
MDDVLKRLLEVEKEADELVASTEKEAENIREQGRAKLAVEYESALADIESKARGVIADHEKSAFEQRDAVLETTDKVLVDWEKQFTDDRLAPVVDAVVDLLSGSTRQ